MLTIFTGLPVRSASSAARQHMEVITSSLPPNEPPSVAWMISTRFRSSFSAAATERRVEKRFCTLPVTRTPPCSAGSASTASGSR